MSALLDRFKRMMSLTANDDDLRKLTRELVRSNLYPTGTGEMLFKVVLVRKGMPDFYYSKNTVKWSEHRGKYYTTYPEAQKRAKVEIKGRVIHRRKAVIQTLEVPWHIEVRSYCISEKTRYPFTSDQSAGVKLSELNSGEIEQLIGVS